MPGAKPHIIKTQFVEVEFENSGSFRDAYEFKIHLSEVCRNKLLPAVEELFDAKCSNDKIISIDRLIVDSGIFENDGWENRFVDETVSKLGQYLDELSNNENSVNDDQDDLDVRGEDVTIYDNTGESEAILHFLKHGVLPWFSTLHSQAELCSSLEVLLNTNTQFRDEVRELILTDEIVFKRCVLQFKDEEIIELLVSQSEKDDTLNLARRLHQSWNNIFDVLRISPGSKKVIFFKALRSAYLHSTNDMIELMSANIVKLLDEKERETLNNLTDRIEEYKFSPDERMILNNIREKDLNLREAKEVEHNDSRTTESDEVAFFEEHPVYLSNSGLVLLHPFLSRLFANIGYTRDDQWISEDSHRRSLVLCQYLIYGHAEYAEFELLLNKILTGYPLDESLPVDIELSDFEKNEANDLLKSVIKHWSALKNTSLEALQETFFQRDGRIVRADTGWLLKVDQKTFDVLLDKIPWGFSTIKTPWMNEILSVEWI